MGLKNGIVQWLEAQAGVFTWKWWSPESPADDSVVIDGYVRTGTMLAATFGVIGGEHSGACM
jgi:hypothetical protein